MCALLLLLLFDWNQSEWMYVRRVRCTQNNTVTHTLTLSVFFLYSLLTFIVASSSSSRTNDATGSMAAAVAAASAFVSTQDGEVNNNNLHNTNIITIF